MNLNGYSQPGTSKQADVYPKRNRFITENDKFILDIPNDPSLKPHSGGVGMLIWESMKLFDDRIAHLNSKTGEKLTYKQYYLKSVRIAQNLLRKRIQSNDLIALCAPNIPEADCIFCAVQFIGNHLCTIDPQYEEAEMTHFISLVKPKILFCWHECLEVVQKSIKKAGLNTQIVSMGTEEQIGVFLNFSEFLAPTGREEYFEALEVDSLFDTTVILFSSGTTDEPKAIELNHYGLLLQNLYLMKSWDFSKTLVSTTLHWIPSIILLITCITNGGTKVFIGEFNPGHYMQYLEEYKITFSFLPTFAVHLLFRNLSELPETNTDALLTLVISGAPINEELVLTLNDIFPKTKIYIVYGLTENSGILTMYTPEDKLDERKICKCCGYGLPGTSYKIVDVVSEKALGPNQPGEIRFKGDAIMNGYYNNTEATVKAFDFDGFYCTNDFGFFDDDYAFFVIDRLSDFIKCQFHTIVPVVVENVLKEMSFVVDAAVIGIPHEEDGEQAMALVVKDPKDDLTETEALEYVHENLPNVRLSAGLKFVDKLPYSPTYKLLRNKLRLWFVENPFRDMIKN